MEEHAVELQKIQIYRKASFYLGLFVFTLRYSIFQISQFFQFHNALFKCNTYV